MKNRDLFKFADSHWTGPIRLPVPPILYWLMAIEHAVSVCCDAGGVGIRGVVYCQAPKYGTSFLDAALELGYDSTHSHRDPLTDEAVITLVGREVAGINVRIKPERLR